MSISFPIIDWAQATPKQRALARPTARNSETIAKRVQVILDRVRREGDEALRAFSQEFDQVKLESPAVSESDLDAQAEKVPREVLEALKVASTNIEKFHEAQRRGPIRVDIEEGITCWRESRPLERVGLYVPGGSAPLPSTALMLGIPAKVAGCQTVVACTPPQKDGKVAPVIAAALKMCGVRRVFCVGGAQAIAAMAFGTESVPRVDKIFGPGNAYVTAAKMKVAEEPGGPAFDLPAGPSEVMVLADGGARPEYVAADLLAQAEHGPDSQVIAVVTDRALGEAVVRAVNHQLGSLPRRQIAEQALQNAAIVLATDTKEAIQIANDYAAEHLILQVRDAERWGTEVKSAGSVFVGDYTPEAVGDYASGTNHVLPTYGNARAYSGLGLDAFTKTITFQRLTNEGLRALGPAVIELADAEQLSAHARSVKIRIECPDD